MTLSKLDRFRVLVRDNFTCRYCGRSAPDVVLEVDHRVPRCRGGLDNEWNLVAACLECNRSKSGMLLPPKMYGEDDVTPRSRQTAEWWVIGVLTDYSDAKPEHENAQRLLWKVARVHPVRLSYCIDKVREWAGAAPKPVAGFVDQFLEIIYADEVIEDLAQ
jgi:hypothetical protein